MLVNYGMGVLSKNIIKLNKFSMKLPELKLDYPIFLVWNRFISKLDGNHFTLVEEEEN